MFGADQIWSPKSKSEGVSSNTCPAQGNPATLQIAGKPVDGSDRKNIVLADVDYTGSSMPPPAAVKAGKVKPLSEEDRRTIFRWIDLGCPIDLDFNPADGSRLGLGSGWMMKRAPR